MRKAYTLLIALVLSVLGVISVNAASQFVDLDVKSFRAWDGFGADAKPVAPQSYEGKEGAVQNFACDFNLGVQLNEGGVVFGNTNVYYLWYANLTGTRKVYFEGSADTRLRVIMNRVNPTEGGDPNGGSLVERQVTIGADGKAEVDVSDLEYIHLNCVKINWGSSGTVDKISILPSGWVSLIYNGNADENDDVSSFPVSFDGPNNKNTANDLPEIVEEGKDGKAFKVTSFAEPAETWHTQFFFLSNETLTEGTKIRLSFDYRAENSQAVTASAQADPRTYNGNLDDLKFTATPDWDHFEWNHTVTAADANNGGFKSIALNLNEDKVGPNTFYFDNIVFEKFIPSFEAEFGEQTVAIIFPYATNIADLVKASGKTRLSYPVECATLKQNGQPVTVEFIEADADGKIYVFPTEDVVFETTDRVELVFTNPDDAALHVAYTEEGRDAISVIEVSATFNESLNEIMPDSYQDPVLESSDPENGSFNLPTSITEFTLTFDKGVDCEALVAKLGKETLAKTPATGFSKEVKLTRKAGDLANGAYTINVTNVLGQFSAEEYPVSFDLKFSVGPSTVSDDDQPEVLYQSNFTTSGDDANGAGWLVTADINEQKPDPSLQAANSTGGNRLQHGQAGYEADVLYLAQRSARAGIALYGTEDDHKLTLKGGKTYHLTLKTAMWDAYPAEGSNRSLRAQVLTEDAVSTEDGTIIDEGGIIAEDFKATIGRVKENKEYTAFDIAFTPEADGNYVIRLVAGNSDGNPAGFNDGNAIADVKVEYIPNVMGIMEIKALQTALNDAKSTLESAEDDKYEGATRDALTAKIQQYDGQETVMTAPSAFTKAVEELKAAAKTMTDHIAFCDEYYTLAQKAYDLSVSKKEKFSEIEYYKDVKAVADKYVTVEGEGEEAVVTIKKETDTDKLSAAKKELSDVTTLAEKWLTEGKSNNEQTSGFAALHERIRRGTELLKSLGVAEDDELIVAANATLGDDDSVAGAIMNRVSSIILSDLASGESQLFAATEEEETAPSYDLSVFVKNPNTYGPAASKEVPGWTATMGSVYAWNSWTGSQSHDVALPPYPEDCSIHAGWHPNGEKGAIVEQTIENLPAGIYSVKLQFWENGEKPGEDAESLMDYSYAFVKVTDTPSPEVDEETGAPIEDFDPELHTAGFTNDASTLLTDLVVLDGKLTVGYHYGKKSQAFLQDVSIFLTAPAEGFNYADAYQKFVTGVDAAKTAKVRGIELYDLNGRRVNSARKGLVIVKKVMSDGTVQTTKVVK